MADQHVLVTFSPPTAMRQAIADTLGSMATVTYLGEVEPDARAGALASADVVMAGFLTQELRGAEEFSMLRTARLLQLLSAGVDHVPFDDIPSSVPVASNAGAYAEPMAEHVLAMALALAKHLPQRHADLQAGVFDHETLNREIRGSTVLIVGFGGIGSASARLFRALGARIHAVTRSKVGEEWVERVATLDGLDEALAVADIVILSIPLTKTTRGLIGGHELEQMKPDAILVNVARGAIIDEDALYAHLVAHPAFQVGIDTWWDEPRGSGQFAARLPFLELPNVLGSPHNSGLTDTAMVRAVRDAATNVARALQGEQVANLVDRGEYHE